MSETGSRPAVRTGGREAWICVTCGTQYRESAARPQACSVCDDERQYVGWDGQRWISFAELNRTHVGRYRENEPDLVALGCEPAFGIGQRALLVRSPDGNLLWDCIAYLGDDLVHAVRELGGVRAIAISHPHYYTTMVEWARTFDAPIFLHSADRDWVRRPDARIEHWQGETYVPWEGFTLIRLGGHFPGGTVLHWPAGAGGRGALLTGDIIQVVCDRRWVSFMYSYPNLIPLSAGEVRRIVSAIEPIRFDRIYGAWWDRNVDSDAKAAVRRSADRYERALTGVDRAPRIDEHSRRDG